MKKVVYLADVKNLSKSVFRFITNLHEKEPFLLVASFFHPLSYKHLLSTTLSEEAEPFVEYTKEEHHEFIKAIEEFEEFCIKQNIEYRIHDESHNWNRQDLVMETRFSDLLVVSEELFFASVEKEQPNRFLKDVLHNAECSILLIPEEYEPVKSVVVAYDGKRESVFALKKLCETFPDYTSLPIEIFYWVNKTDDEIPGLDYLEEFVGRHFTNANLREAFFDPSEYLSDWVKSKKNTLFVSGSFSRSWLSTLFKKSFTAEVIRKHAALVFIAHP
jgi:hypothetical protein